MKNFIQIEFTVPSNVELRLLLDSLNDDRFLGFEELEAKLIAYVLQSDFNAEMSNYLDKIQQNFNLQYSTSIIEDQNWNAQWEADYEPVVVEDYCSIRAEFHAPIDQVEFNIMVTPKMSFGTGHHETTYMMIHQMSHLDFNHKKVLDYGCGTGVLAILAALEGASHVEAIDYDPWSYENTLENCVLNAIDNKIHCSCGELTDLEVLEFDIILANINRNVILENMELLVKKMKIDAVLLVSGILVEDERIILQNAAKNGLKSIKVMQKGDWLSILFSKS